MLTEEQLEYISATIVPLFQYLEKEVIADIARRIAKTLTYSRTAELQAIAMMKLGYSPARIRKEAMKMLNADLDFRMVTVTKSFFSYAIVIFSFQGVNRPFKMPASTFPFLFHPCAAQIAFKNSVESQPVGIGNVAENFGHHFHLGIRVVRHI